VAGDMKPYAGRKIVTYHRSWPTFAVSKGLDVERPSAMFDRRSNTLANSRITRSVSHLTPSTRHCPTVSRDARPASVVALTRGGYGLSLFHSVLRNSLS